MTFLDYGHVAYAYEHTRLQVSDRILHTDKTSSYMLYAMRTASVKKVRAMQHGITDVNFWGSIMRCWTLKRAQHGNQNSLDSLVEWWAPSYTAPTASIWSYKEPYLNILVQQGRITQEFKDDMAATAVVETPKKTVSWNDVKDAGYRM